MPPYLTGGIFQCMNDTTTAVQAPAITRGTLFLVVGPSGAGKDSLIEGAKATLAGDSRFVFPRRYITRAADAGGENHIPVSEPMFETLLERGEIMLEWRAHNLRYGVSRAVEEHLNRGRHVVLNVSRTVVDAARLHFPPVRVLYVTVAEEILAARLKARGRESAVDIKRRVARAGEYLIIGDDVTMIDNGGALETSISSFVVAIEGARSA